MRVNFLWKWWFFKSKRSIFHKSLNTWLSWKSCNKFCFSILNVRAKRVKFRYEDIADGPLLHNSYRQVVVLFRETYYSRRYSKRRTILGERSKQGSKITQLHTLVKAPLACSLTLWRFYPLQQLVGANFEPILLLQRSELPKEKRKGQKQFGGIQTDRKNKNEIASIIF